MKGLEPLLREKLDPKSSASTNSATPACRPAFEGAKIQLFYLYWMLKSKIQRSAGSNSKCKNSGNLDAKLKEPVFRGVEV